MEYISTRNNSDHFSFKNVFLKGLADDGGLFVPKSIKPFSKDELTKLNGLSYNELAAEIIFPFIGDFMTKEKLSTDANTRINAMVGTQDGFELAEVDLKLRGPGNLMGTQQSGVLQMIIADLTKDQSILENARKAALSLLQKDPNINSKINSAITSTLLQLERGKGIWKYIS